MRLRVPGVTGLVNDVEDLFAQATNVVIGLQLFLCATDHLGSSLIVIDQEVQRLKPLVFCARENAAAIGTTFVINRASTRHDSRTASGVFYPFCVGFHQVEVDRYERTNT